MGIDAPDYRRVADRLGGTAPLCRSPARSPGGRTTPLQALGDEALANV